MSRTGRIRPSPDVRRTLWWRRGARETPSSIGCQLLTKAPGGTQEARTTMQSAPIAPRKASREPYVPCPIVADDQPHLHTTDLQRRTCSEGAAARLRLRARQRYFACHASPKRVDKRVKRSVATCRFSAETKIRPRGTACNGPALLNLFFFPYVLPRTRFGFGTDRRLVRYRKKKVHGDLRYNVFIDI